MTEEEKQDIVNKLEDRQACGPCPRCGTKKFTLLDGYVTHRVQAAIEGVESIFCSKFNPIVPMVMTVCNNCGFMSHHALGILKELLPESEQDQKWKKSFKSKEDYEAAKLANWGHEPDEWIGL